LFYNRYFLLKLQQYKMFREVLPEKEQLHETRFAMAIINRAGHDWPGLFEMEISKQVKAVLWTLMIEIASMEHNFFWRNVCSEVVNKCEVK
jgi:hypothetical protein